MIIINPKFLKIKKIKLLIKTFNTYNDQNNKLIC